MDEAERGHSVLVTRAGRRVALIGPVSTGNGAEAMALLHGSALDDEFAADVTAARDAVVLEDPAWRDG